MFLQRKQNLPLQRRKYPLIWSESVEIEESFSESRTVGYVEI
jgi:hypothetical protein